MILSLFIGLALGAVAVIFALQNIATVSVNFLWLELQGSLALVIILGIVAGILISMLVSIPEVIKTHMKFRALRKRNKSLEDEVASLRSSMATRETTKTTVETPQGVAEKVTTTETTLQ